MIASMPPLRIFWPSASAYELDHGSMDMPREGTTIARSHAYPLSSGPAGFAEEHIEHWTASTSTYTDAGKAEIGPNDGRRNKSRSGFLDWLGDNPTLAVQYTHRRVFRFERTDGTDDDGKSVVPDPTVAGDEILTVDRDGVLFATGLRRATSAGARTLWKLSGDLLAGHTYELFVGGAAGGLTAAEFIDNQSSDPGYLSTVSHAYYEDVSDFPGGPGSGGSNVPLD